MFGSVDVVGGVVSLTGWMGVSRLASSAVAVTAVPFSLVSGDVSTTLESESVVVSVVVVADDDGGWLVVVSAMETHKDA